MKHSVLITKIKIFSTIAIILLITSTGVASKTSQKITIAMNDQRVYYPNLDQIYLDNTMLTLNDALRVSLNDKKSLNLQLLDAQNKAMSINMQNKLTSTNFFFNTNNQQWTLDIKHTW